MVSVTKKILKILDKKQKRVTVIMVIMMLIGGIMESLSISLLYPLLSAITSDDTWNSTWYSKLICNILDIGDNYSYVKALIIILILVFIFKNAYLLLEYYLQYSFISKSRYKMQSNLMASYLRKPYSFYISANSGEIVRIITSDAVQVFNALTSTFSFYTELIVSIVLGITIILISPTMAFTLICLLLIELIVVSRFIKPIMKRIGDRNRTENGIANKWILQSINGIKSIKVTHTESFFKNNYDIHANRIVDCERKNQTISNIPRLLIEMFTICGVLVLMLIMIEGGISLKEFVPQLSAFVVAAVRLLPSVNRISTSMNTVPYYEGSIDIILDIMNQNNTKSLSDNSESLITTSIIEKNTRKESFSFEKTIEFSDISFAYDREEGTIFDHASFSIKKGESIGIVGASGAGKTTAMDIILGLLKPDNGCILVDGRNIEDNINGWLSHLAYIPQSIFLIDDTVKANVAFGAADEEIDEELVWRVLKEAKMDDYIYKLPKKLETRVGEQGIRLSGGQRQRIGIARALYSGPDVIFLDEATSALDGETERAIMESIDSLKGRITMIIIAHRLSTISNCDRIYRVNKGKVFEDNK